MEYNKALLDYNLAEANVIKAKYTLMYNGEVIKMLRGEKWGDDNELICTTETLFIFHRDGFVLCLILFHERCQLKVPISRDQAIIFYLLSCLYIDPLALLNVLKIPFE